MTEAERARLALAVSRIREKVLNLTTVDHGYIENSQSFDDDLEAVLRVAERALEQGGEAS